MVKKVFDRIFKTFAIVLDVIWGLIMSLYCIGALWQSNYSIESSIGPVIMSTVVLVMVNAVNIIIRRWIKNY